METPDEFPFPFTPYPIQTEFMKNLYDCLENGKCGIFESPTGTGKTLSIICGAVKWLLDKKESEKKCYRDKINEISGEIQNIEKKYGNDWFSAQIETMAKNKEKENLEAKLNKIVQHEEKLQQYRDKAKLEAEAKKQRAKNLAKYKRLKESNKDEVQSAESKDQLVKSDEVETDDYDLVLKDDKGDDSSDSEEDEIDEYECTKLIFCSRTHSQLGQFIDEMKKSIYAKDVSVVPIASRSNYCVNKDVRSLGTNEAINDRCLELQKLKKKATVKKEKVIKRAKTSSLSRCPFMPGDQLSMAGSILGDIKDVEDIAKSSKELETCAYYATRKVVKDGQIILVPYNSVLHKNTRESSSISLKGNVLIIDEAHNLLDAIERMHSSTISARNVLHCFQQLSRYQTRFQTMLSAVSVLSLNQLSHFLKKVLSLFGGSTKSQPEDKIELTYKVYNIVEFQTLVGLENVYNVLDFVSRTKLVQKLRGYADKYETGVQINSELTAKQEKGISAFLSTLQTQRNQSEPVIDEKTHQVAKENEKLENEVKSNPLMSIVNFLECLKTSCEDGRIFLLPGATFGQSTLKFILLNPASQFSDIVKEARAVILAGGTMAPMYEFRDHLLMNAGVEPERIVTFSCDHIIPRENICTIVQTCGPTGIEFDFKFQNRGNTAMIDELGRTLVNLMNIVPAGVVVFLPSYNIEDTIYKHFESTGVLTKLSVKKKIFREPKLSSQVNQVLDKYASAVKNPASPQNGALLFSVVGGKLSEGLNFSDDLGRCVIVVGMPFPNIKSAELTEKMKYLNTNCKGFSGQVYYENLCYKAVNQCIGRAVRHIGDYSAIILMDKRYSSKVKFLPAWIQRSNVTVNSTFGGTISSVAKFFASKRKVKTN